MPVNWLSAQLLQPRRALLLSLPLPVPSPLPFCWHWAFCPQQQACSESSISRKVALQKGAESRQLAQISNPAHLRPEKCQCTRKSGRRGAGTIFSGGYCLNQNSFPTEPQPKIWKCRNGYPASIKSPRLSVSSCSRSSDILHALLQAPCLPASAAAGTSTDPV